MRKYIVSGCAIVDRVLSGKGGSVVRQSLGGGAVYALSGIKLWHDDCLLACYSGRDFADYYGGWLQANGLSAAGVVPQFPKTNVCELYYRPDGTHTMGAGDPDYSTFPGDRPDFALLRPYLAADPASLAIHLVTGYVPELLEQLNPYREKGLLLGYEIDPEDPSFPNIAENIATICEQYVDFFSISFAELQEIFPAMGTIEQAVDYCAGLKCPAFLRAGETGAYMIRDGAVVHAPMINSFGNEDPTGCGNTSTAAAFYAFCENKSLKETAIMGSVTASLNAGSKGLIREITPEIRTQCAEMVRALMK